MLSDIEPAATAVTVEATLRIGRSAAALLSCHAPRSAERDQIATTALRTLANDDRLTIARRPSGRPRLLPPYPELGVSLSHRRGLLLAGFSPDSQVGVDVETAAPGLDAPRLASDHFAAGEAAAVAQAAAASAEDARDLFLRLWVAKEAVLKATGRGVYDGLDAPDLSARVPALHRDGAVFDCPASARSPAAVFALSRSRVADGTLAYIALAVLLS